MVEKKDTDKKDLQQAGEPFLRTTEITDTVHAPALADGWGEDVGVLWPKGAAHAREGSRCSTWQKRTARNSWVEPVHHDLDYEILHLEKHRRAVHSPPLRACQRQGASGTGCMILPPNKLKGWRPTSSMPGRCDISGCDLTHPPPLQVPKSLSPPSPALANLPQSHQNIQEGLQAGSPLLRNVSWRCGNYGNRMP